MYGICKLQVGYKSSFAYPLHRRIKHYFSEEANKESIESFEIWPLRRSFLEGLTVSHLSTTSISAPRKYPDPASNNEYKAY